MAKRKKTKKGTGGTRPPATQSAEDARPQNQAEPIQTAINLDKTKPANTKKPAPPNVTPAQGGATGPKTVRFSTCVAGMFLTLILGIYIGTLLPGVFEGQEQVVQQPVPAQPAEPAQMDSALKRSIAEAEKKAAANPDSAPEWIHLGNLYFDAHMPERAITAYEHSLALAPKNPDVLVDLGIMYREVGQFEKAVEHFRRASAIEPGHQNAMLNEGIVLSNDLHRKEEAIAAWERLLQFNPSARAVNGMPVSEMIKQLR